MLNKLLVLMSVAVFAFGKHFYGNLHY